MLNIKFITPEKILFDGEASYVSAQTFNGGIGIYKDHQPLLALLKTGNLQIKNGNIIKNFFIESDNGFIEVDSNVILITAPQVKVL